MAISVLSLPADIKWELVAISPDMFARDIAAPLPVKWRSSLAVFAYNPVPDSNQEEDAKEITTFIKVVATITGYQVDAELDRDALKSMESLIVPNFLALADSYYPAYSALVQVAVFPHDGQGPLKSYPYFSDFEPKKREVVELVSDAGETLSQSSSQLNVRKSSTSADSQERIDIDHGYSVSQSMQGGGFGGSTSGDVRRDRGTRSQLGSGTENIMTSDSSRERRDLYSHVTNLSQLYHVLDSYHLGTNRALFFVNARPHFVDSPMTFVHGLRRLEGVQEFFLVVKRPKDTKDFCVKVVLETGHLHESERPAPPGPGAVPETSALAQSFHLANNGDYEFGDVINVDKPEFGAWTIPIPSGWKVDTSQGGGIKAFNYGGDPIQVTVPKGVDYEIAKGWRTRPGYWTEMIPQITVYEDHVDVKAAIHAWIDAGGDGSAQLSFTVTVFTVRETAQVAEPTATSTLREVDLFITAREVVGCPGQEIPPGVVESTYVAYEKPMPAEFVAQLWNAQSSIPQSIVSANAASRLLRDEMIRSFRSSARYGPGKVRFLESKFAMRTLMRGRDVLRTRQMSTPLDDDTRLSPDLRKQVQKNLPRLTAAGALRLPPEVLARKVGVTSEEAQTMQARLLGVASRPPKA